MTAPVQRRAGRLPGLMLGYFALVGIFLVALVASIRLHASLQHLHTAALQENQAWARRQADYAHIGQLAAAANRPANDVFQSDDPDGERLRLEAALRPFGDAVVHARNDIDAMIAASASEPREYRVRLHRLRSHLDAISDASLSTIEEAYRIFAFFRTGQVAGAGARMAVMDREYERLADQVAGMGFTVREIQDFRYAMADQAAEKLQQVEQGIAVAIGVFLLGVIGYGYGIVRRLRRSASEVVESEARLRSVLDTAADAIVTADERGQIQSWNAAAERIFGYRADEALGGNVSMLAAAPHDAQHGEYIARSLATGEAPAIGRVREMGARRKDGGQFDAELAISDADLESGHLFTAIVRDITARKQTESELRAAKEDAEAATRAKSLFLANMSHEIRTPMNGVIGMTGLLLDTSLTAEQREFAETIRTSADTLLTIINDILDFSKIESGRLDLEAQPFEIDECIEGALDLIAPRAGEKHLELTYAVDATVPPRVIGDVTRLRQVLVNLLGNAVKFTAAGEVHLDVSARPGPNDTLHAIEFAVTDTGIGIPAERMDRLFQSFSQVDASTNRQYGGTGLGLAISKRLTELMGGRLVVTSTAGQGSCFRFSIVAAAAAGPPRRHRHANEPLLAGRSILLVDDNPTNRRILTLQTEAWGMRPHPAASGAEALAWLDHGERFDLAILDMQMPGMDGVALAHALRAHSGIAALPLVLLSSMGCRPVDAALFDAMLTKPVKPSQLFDAVIGVLEPLSRQRPVTGALHYDTQLATRLPLRILLAEDNAINQKVALRVLERMGYRADLAANGFEVLQALERQTYDVVLLDVQMPEMDGLSAAREICRRWPLQRPRLVAMTANAMAGDREICLAAGMDDYISKPVRAEVLHAALERCAPVAALPAAGAA